MGIFFSSAIGSKILLIAQATLDLHLGKPKLKHIFIACQNVSRNENGKLFLHKNGWIITHTIRPPAALSKLESIQYQEIIPYATTLIEAKQKGLNNEPEEPQLHNNFNSAIIDSNPLLKFHLTMVVIQTLKKTVFLPSIISE